MAPEYASYTVMSIQHGEEGFLGNLYTANLLHTLFTLFLFFQQFPLA